MSPRNVPAAIGNRRPHVDEADTPVVESLGGGGIDLGGALDEVLAVPLAHDAGVIVVGQVDPGSLGNAGLPEAGEIPVAVLAVVVEHVAVPPPSRFLHGQWIEPDGNREGIVLLDGGTDALTSPHMTIGRDQRRIILGKGSTAG